MTEQRISLLLFPFLLAAVGCGGGGGAPIDVGDPTAPPEVADQQPPPSNQNPASTAALPPDNSQDPPPDPNEPGSSSGGGGCVELCNDLPDYGCQTPEDGCAEGCSELLADDCGPQLFALEVCALEEACPEQLLNISVERAQRVANLCPSQYLAFVNCRNRLVDD